MFDIFGTKNHTEAMQREKFQNILNFANQFIEPGNPGLRSLIRLLGRVAQSRAMVNSLGYNHKIDPVMAPNYVWFNDLNVIDSYGVSLDKIKIKFNDPQAIKLKLGVDLILPSTWTNERVFGNLCAVGEGKIRGAWRQDSNHKIEWWLPVGLGWVSGGNHSLTAGIVNGEGFVTPDSVYDISEVYKYVKCDGVSFTSIKTGIKLADVKDIEFAAIFEIGRKMVEKGVTY